MEFQDIKLTIGRRRNAMLWSFSLVFAMLLNLGLFAFMPNLISSNTKRYNDVEAFRIDSVIRLKRPETPPRKREIKKPEKPEKVDRTLKPTVKRMAKVKKVSLPFEINTQLPVGPNTLALPDVQMVALDAPVMNDAYGVGDLDGPLTPLAQVPPIYPLRAKRLGIEGWVKVKFMVSDQGMVEDIQILDAEPEKVFNESVIRCVSSWRFKPGTVHGEPVDTWVATTIRFELD